jgi:signal transduction histidine kinase
MIGNRKASVSVLFVSLLCHGLAVWYYSLNAHLFPVPPRWHLQIYALLSGSAALSLVLPFTTSAAWDTLVLGLKFFALALIGYPLGEYMGLETALVIPLLLETVMKFAFPWCIAAGLGQIAVLAALQKPHTVWDVQVLQAQLDDMIFFAVNSSIVLFLSGVIKYLAQTLSAREREIGRLDSAVEKITSINLEYQTYASTVERESSERERKRITREIHDIIGYTLTNQLMIIQAALVCKDTDRAKLNELLLKAQSQLAESIDEARAALRRLRNTDRPHERGAQLFLRLAKTFETITGVTVEVEFANMPGAIEPGIETAICRLLQEGLTNAFRHGKATAIRIGFWYEERTLHIHVHDNGKGQEKAGEGIGLAGMRERFSALGGGVTAGPAPDGFSLKAWIPVESAPAAERYE